MSELAIDAPVIDQTTTTDPPLDFAQYEAFMDAKGQGPDQAAPEIKAPAAGEQTTPPSEPADPSIEGEAGQIAEASEPAEPITEQVTAEDEEEEAAEEIKESRLHKRLRVLTGELKGLKGTIAQLETRLGGLDEDEADDEIPGEVASPPAAVTVQPEPLVRPVRPKLEDFEDTDDKSAWKQLEEAQAEHDVKMEAYTDAKIARESKATVEAHKAELTREREQNAFLVSKAASDAAWAQAASRFPDYQEVMARPEVVVSSAMIATMKMDPTSGTELAYYLGHHPEESRTLANETLVNVSEHFREGSQEYKLEWQRLFGLAMARSAMKLGEIKAKLTPPTAPKTAAAAPGKAPVPGTRPPAATPATPPQPKKITSAKPPPTQIRSTAAAPELDVNSETGAANYADWEKRMNALEAARNGRR